MAIAGGGSVFCKIHLGRGKNTTVAELSGLCYTCLFLVFFFQHSLNNVLKMSGKTLTFHVADPV